MSAGDAASGRASPPHAVITGAPSTAAAHTPNAPTRRWIIVREGREGRAEGRDLARGDVGERLVQGHGPVEAPHHVEQPAILQEGQPAGAEVVEQGAERLGPDGDLRVQGEHGLVDAAHAVDGDVLDELVGDDLGRVLLQNLVLVHAVLPVT